MSAIFGIVNKNGVAIDSAIAAKMQHTLLHRAVDGKVMVISGEVMFGHHKLIVHRRQKDEIQPIESEGLIITCDARIDNILFLIEELNLAHLPGITDPLIIAEAYAKWGKECVQYFEGEFAFAIWDKSTKTFFAATDHIGFRTFYFYENDEIFAFASEIRALSVVKTAPLIINDEIFFEYFTNLHHNITYDVQINSLQSAHCIVLEKNRKSDIKRYWTAGATGKYLYKEPEEWSDALRNLMVKKIEAMLDTDYQVGILLSGGLDSSFVCAIACDILNKQNKKLHAFCSVLPENYTGEEKDERYYIEKLDDHFDNLEVHYVTIPENVGPYTNLEKAFDRVEFPINAFHYVESAMYDEAQRWGVRSLLTGFGGDFTISHKGVGLVYHLFMKGKFKEAWELFIIKYKQVSKTRLIKTEILPYSSLYKKMRYRVKGNEFYDFLPLKKDFLRRIIKAYNSRKPDRFENVLNKGEMGCTQSRQRKHGIAFNLEFLSPILCKEICELSFDIPCKFLSLNGLNRSWIKGGMQNMVPSEILKRTDKLPFAPDYYRKTAKLLEYSEVAGNPVKSTALTNLISEKYIFTTYTANNNEGSLSKPSLFFLPFIYCSYTFYERIVK